MRLRVFTVAALAALAGTGAQSQDGRQEIRIVTEDIRGALPGAGPLQPMGAGTGVIFGQVTEADSSRPVPGAIVSLSIPGAQPIRVMADGQGRFGFRDLPAGRFSLSATRPGWVDGAYGRTRPAGPTLPLVLTDGEKVSGVTVPMWRYAAITGTVVDEAGEPIVSKPVRVLRRTIVGGRIRLVPGPQDLTDDRGIFRIGNLEPGDYIVAVPMEVSIAGALPIDALAAGDRIERAAVVAVRTATEVAAASGGTMVVADTLGAPAGITDDGRLLMYPTMFYPNAATAARAGVLTLASGEERAAVDFRLRPIVTSSISGIMMGPDGPAPNLQVTLVPAEAEEFATSIDLMTGFSDAQGRFSIPGVPPGQYLLRAVRTPRVAMGPGETTTIQQGGNVMVMRTATANVSAPLPTEPTLWAELSVVVGTRDVTDLTVGLRPGLKMTGMVQFNGGAARPASETLPSIALNLEPAESRPGLTGTRGRIEPSGQFATLGVPPGRYVLRVAGAPPGWTFHSAMVNGRDASVVPVEIESGDVGGVLITFTDRPSELSGDVTVDAGEPEAATVLVFPTDSSAWVGYGTVSRRFAESRVGRDGRFRIVNLPAGDYFAIALPDRLAADWRDPKRLEALAAQATRVRIGDGQRVTQSLRVLR